MRDREEEEQIKEYMRAKMKHIKMYNECMNLADGLDVAKFAELVREDERQACIDIIQIEHIAKPEIIRAIKERGKK